eukprot:g10670.t1
MDRWSELHYDARGGSIERTLASISSRLDVDEATPAGLAPLIIAASRGQVGVVRVLTKKGAGVTAASNEGGITALHASAREGCVAVTRLLVKAGVDVEAKISTGATPPYFFLAAGAGQVELMEELSRARANVNSLPAEERLRYSWRLREDVWIRSRCSFVRGRTHSSHIRFHPGKCMSFTTWQRKTGTGRKVVHGHAATESQLRGLEATRRLLIRVEAVHAVPWLWHNFCHSLCFKGSKHV